MTSVERVYNFLRKIAEAGRELPTSDAIEHGAKVRTSERVDAIRELVASGRLKIQVRNGANSKLRRVVFPDGVMSRWPSRVKSRDDMSLTSGLIQRVPVTDYERKLIEEAVAAGKVQKIRTAYCEINDE